MKIETDTVEICSGLRHGRTLGSPIAVLVANRDYANWEERMNPWQVEGKSYAGAYTCRQQWSLTSTPWPGCCLRSSPRALLSC